MTAAHRAAKRPDIDDHLVRIGAPRAAKDRVAAGWKDSRRRPDRCGRAQRIEPLQTGGPEQPEDFRRRTLGRPREIRPIEHCC
jgi:hypothetical protein